MNPEQKTGPGDKTTNNLIEKKKTNNEGTKILPSVPRVPTRRRKEVSYYRKHTHHTQQRLQKAPRNK